LHRAHAIYCPAHHTANLLGCLRAHGGQGFFIAGTMRKGVVPGAVNVPLYSLIGGNTFYKQARRAGFSYIFGVLNGQEVRSDFVKEVLAAIPKKDTPIVVMCDSKYPTMEVRSAPLRSAPLAPTLTESATTRFHGANPAAHSTARAFDASYPTSLF
jgi:hypothetical protein